MTQLALDLFAQPRDGAELLSRLRELGLRRIERCRLTSNRRTMLSYREDELRIHRGYLGAPLEVLRAVVDLVEGGAARRRLARRIVLGYRVPVERKIVRRDQAHPDDYPMVRRLRQEHARLNAERFGGELRAIEIRVSRQMKSRLGHYSPAVEGYPSEIAVSRRHIRRHGWSAAIETLIHEMVHQWQDETGRPLDHGRAFRQKAIEVGIEGRARRRPDEAVGSGPLRASG